MIIENKGTLQFYDSARRFIKEEYALRNLTREHDVCVYSLIPKGKNAPEYLIIKAAMVSDTNKYQNGTTEELCLSMSIQNYNKTDPMGLFNRARRLLYFCYALTGPRFWKREDYCYHEEPISAEEFFSIEVDPDSDDPGVQIYLRDKASFLGIPCFYDDLPEKLKE